MFRVKTPEWQRQSSNCRAERDGQLRPRRAELEEKTGVTKKVRE